MISLFIYFLVNEKELKSYFLVDISILLPFLCQPQPHYGQSEEVTDAPGGPDSLCWSLFLLKASLLILRASASAASASLC